MKKNKKRRRRRNSEGDEQTNSPNPDAEKQKRQRNPPPRTTVAELAVEAGLVHPDGTLSRSMAEIATGFLQNLVEVRWDSKTGEPRVLAKEIQRSLDLLTHLRATATCLLIPPGGPGDWYGCPPTALQRNPIVGVHIVDGLDDLADGDDYFDDEDYEEEEDE